MLVGFGVVWWTWCLFNYVWLICGGEKQTSVILLQKSLPRVWVWTYMNQFISSLVWYKAALNFKVWYQLWDLSLHSSSFVWERESFCIHFVAVFSISVDEIYGCCWNMLEWCISPQFHSICIQKREPYFSDVMKNTLNSGMPLDALKLTPFKFDMMRDMMRCYSLIPVLVTLNFIQGNQVMETQLNLQEFCHRVSLHYCGILFKHLDWLKHRVVFAGLSFRGDNLTEVV